MKIIPTSTICNFISSVISNIHSLCFLPPAHRKSFLYQTLQKWQQRSSELKATSMNFSSKATQNHTFAMAARSEALVLDTAVKNVITISINTVWKLPHQLPTTSSPIPPSIYTQPHQKLATNTANADVMLVESRSTASCTIARRMI